MIVAPHTSSLLPKEVILSALPQYFEVLFTSISWERPTNNLKIFLVNFGKWKYRNQRSQKDASYFKIKKKISTVTGFEPAIPRSEVWCLIR